MTTKKSGPNLKRLAIGVAGIIVSVVAVVLIWKKIDLEETFRLLKSVPLHFYFIMIGVYLSTFLLRAYRWQLMLIDHAAVSFKDCLNGVVIGFGGNNLVPARGGEILRMAFFSRATKVNNVTALSSIFIEKVLDGLSLVAILFIALAMRQSLFDEPWLKQVTYTTTGLFVVSMSSLIILRLFSSGIIKFLEEKKPPLHALFVGLISKVSSSLKFINYNRKSLFIVLLSFIIWIIEGSMFVIGLKAFDIHMGILLMGYFTLTIVNFGLLVPSSPGYIGVFQAMTVMALLLFGIEEETALSYSILVHSCQFLPVTIWAIAIFMKTSISGSKK